MKIRSRGQKISDIRQLPASSDFEEELKREKHRVNFRRTLQSTVFYLVVASAAAILIAMFLFPVLHIYGGSMEPSYQDGDVVVVMKGRYFEEGDVIAFYVGNKILLKRYIAGPGDKVDITKEGKVYVNNQRLDEPYVSELSMGQSDIDYPYYVPDSRCFVLGDNREVSADSRNSTIGCVASEQIMGKVVFRLWPVFR